MLDEVLIDPMTRRFNSMGLLDKVKKAAEGARARAGDLADQHGDKVKSGIDKAADAVDKRTKGKHGDKVRKGADKAKAVVDDLADDADGRDDPEGEGGAGRSV